MVPPIMGLSTMELLKKAKVMEGHDKFDEALNFYDVVTLRMRSTRDGLPPLLSAGTPPSSPARSPPTKDQVLTALVGKGVALGRLGRGLESASALEEALEIDPQCSAGLHALAFLRIKEERLEEGMALFRKCLAVDPACLAAAEGLATMLTDEGTRLKQAGQAGLGLAKYEEAVGLHPGYAPAHYNIGIVLADRGGVDEAMKQYMRAVELCPTYAEAHNNIGVLLKVQGQLEEAIKAYRRSLEVNPNFRLASHNLSLALCEFGCKAREQGRVKDAIDLLEEALFHNPKSADGMYHLGAAFAECGETRRACTMYELSAQFNPRFAEAHNNLGVLHKDFENLPRAIQCYQAALRIRPAFPEALNNMGVVYTIMCQPEDAVSYFEAALKVMPTYSEAYTNLGKFLQDAGDAEKAIEQYDRCLAINPLSDNAAHNRLLASNYSIVREPAELTRWHEVWGQTFAARADTARGTASLESGFNNARDPDRVIRIGYLSPDFNTHSVAYFAEAALSGRGRGHSQVYCYCASRKEDETTKRMKAMCDVWRVVAGKKAEEVYNMVRADAIDILVELAGHTAGNRLDVMALRPAPIQIAWIGYPNTTGLKTIDYRLTDANVDPPESPQRFTEELVMMPDCFLCYTPPLDAPPPSPAPCELLGHVTFGSFNNVAKINASVVRLWARILCSVPDSRIVFKSRAFAASQVKESCSTAFCLAGVDTSRIDMMMATTSTRSHLECYSRMDISLDTFPYAGTTTTLESLLMGVPVVTLQSTGSQSSHAHNVGVSILRTMGLDELVAKNEEEYIRIAVSLASAPERVAEMRQTLRERMLASPLCQREMFVEHLEAKYRWMWKKWCRSAGRGEKLVCGGTAYARGGEARGGEEDVERALTPRREGERERGEAGGEGGRGPRDTRREVSRGPEGVRCEE